MSATNHNATALYALVEQPGATFSTTSGGFDTGRRVFKCWQSVVATLEPLRGSPDSVYQGMKVDTVSTTFDKSGVATIEVNYLGVKNETHIKEDEFNYSVAYDNDGFVVESTEGRLSFDYSSAIMKPQVTHTYLTKTLPTTKVGEFATPPKYADLVPSDTITFAELGVAMQFNYYFKGWMLIGRTIKTSGEMHQITDTYLWDFKVIDVSYR